MGIGKKWVLDGSRGVFWPPRCLFWRKIAKILKFQKFVFRPDHAYIRPEIVWDLFFSGSLDPGDAFCTVARLRNSFSDDSRGFEKFPSENDRKTGDDQYSWKFLGSQNILPATKILFFSGSRLELSLGEKNHVKIMTGTHIKVRRTIFSHFAY